MAVPSIVLQTAVVAVAVVRARGPGCGASSNIFKNLRSASSS